MFSYAAKSVFFILTKVTMALTMALAYGQFCLLFPIGLLACNQIQQKRNESLPLNRNLTLAASIGYSWVVTKPS